MDEIGNSGGIKPITRQGDGDVVPGCSFVAKISEPKRDCRLEHYINVQGHYQPAL